MAKTRDRAEQRARALCLGRHSRARGPCFGLVGGWRYPARSLAGRRWHQSAGSGRGADAAVDDGGLHGVRRGGTDLRSGAARVGAWLGVEDGGRNRARDTGYRRVDPSSTMAVVHRRCAVLAYVTLVATPLLAARPLAASGHRRAATASVATGVASGLCLGASVPCQNGKKLFH